MTYAQAVKPFLDYTSKVTDLMLKKGHGKERLNFGLIINCYTSDFNPLECADMLSSNIPSKSMAIA